MEVNHKNADKLDNRPENLEYMTRAQNIAHSHKIAGRKRTSLRGSLVPNAVLTEFAVKDIRALLASGERQTDIAAKYGVTKSAIWNIAHGKWWKWVE
jgi:transcriptional regulator of NAD metabolism